MRSAPGYATYLTLADSGDQSADHGAVATLDDDVFDAISSRAGPDLPYRRRPRRSPSRAGDRLPVPPFYNGYFDSFEEVASSDGVNLVKLGSEEDVEQSCDGEALKYVWVNGEQIRR